MKLYIVYGGWDHEGYDKPFFVTDDPDKAAHAKKNPVYKGYDKVRITELELNVMKD